METIQTTNELPNSCAFVGVLRRCGSSIHGVHVANNLFMATERWEAICFNFEGVTFVSREFFFGFRANSLQCQERGQRIFLLHVDEELNRMMEAYMVVQVHPVPEVNIPITPVQDGDELRRLLN